MAYVEADILGALVGRVNALSLGLPISWPNVHFTPPTDGKYIAVSFMPNGSQRLGINGGTPHRLRGLMQLSVFWPRGTGEVAPMQQADTIAAGFPADLKLKTGAMTVRITKDADIVGALYEDNAIHIPVTVEWEAFA